MRNLIAYFTGKRKGLLGLFCVALGGVSLGAVEPLDFTIPEGNLTLVQAHELALKNNPGVREVLQTLVTAEAQLKQSLSANYPSLSLSSSAMAQDASVQLDWSPDSRVNDGFNYYSLGLNFRWVLFDGFARRAQILASKYQIENQREQLLDFQRLLLDAVNTAYYQSQLARELMQVARDNYLFNQQQESDVNQRFLAGDVPESEKLNFSIRVYEAGVSYRNARLDFDLSTTVLASLLQNDEEEPQVYYPVSQIGEANARLMSFDEAYDYALEHRPDFKQLGLQKDILQQRERAVSGQYYPTLALTAGTEYERYDATGDYEQNENNRYLGLTLSWDLFSGKRRQGQRMELKSMQRTVDYTRRRMLLELQSEIRQQLLSIASARDVFRLQLAASKETRVIVDHVARAYEEGEATVTRLNEAQTNHVRVSGNLAQAKINLLLAQGKLDVATGKILEMNRAIINGGQGID